MERRASLSSAKREIERISTRIKKLLDLLEDSDTRTEATEALRGLIDAITLTPDQGELRIELKGNLAAMLNAATNAKRSPETGDLSLQVVMVAGGGFEPPTFGL
jgi:site-specific DNA recombinase